jgi:hypothetical protein
LRRSTSRLFSACSGQLPTGFEPRAQLTLARQSETVASATGLGGVMMRTRTAAIVTAFAGILLATGAQAQTAPSGIRSGVQLAQASPPADASAPRPARRPPIRLRVYPRYQPEPDGVYPRYFPGRNAVRDCTATYVQEYRPSGTVIVPRMNCFWRPG